MIFTLREQNSPHFSLKMANIPQHNLRYGGNVFMRAFSWLKEKLGPIIEKVKKVADETGFIDKVAKPALLKIGEKAFEKVKEKLFSGNGLTTKDIIGNLRKRVSPMQGAGLAILA